MGDVIDLQAERENRTPHVSGKAHCVRCQHKWVAVAPVGTTWLECPNCQSMMGTYSYRLEIPGPHFTCSCGNDLFHIHADGAYCPNCGHWKSDLKL